MAKCRLPAPAAARSAAAAARSAATGRSSTDAGASARRIAPCLSAMVVSAEGARTDTALAAGFSISSSSPGVSVEGSGRCARTVVNAATPADVASASSSAAVGVSSAARSSSVEIAPVVESVASGVVPVVVINCEMVMPIESPMGPPPSKPAEEADSEADSEREVRAAIPDSRIRIPARPRQYGISVNQPRIIRRNVNDIGIRRLNDDRRALRRYVLLRRGLKIAGSLRSLTHHLYGIHHVLLLVVIGVA